MPLADRSVMVPDAHTFSVVEEPPRPAEHCWAGAPSALVAPDGVFWCFCRLRTPERRGYELRLLRSADVETFDPVGAVYASDLNVKSIERSALVFDKRFNRYELYLSYHRETWEIGAAPPARRPDRFDVPQVRSLDSLLRPGVSGVKDPYVFELWDHWWMLYTGYEGRRERTFVARRRNDGAWEPWGSGPVLDNTGWHKLFTRPSCVLPADDGGVFIYYEGCDGTEYSPIYNLALGLAYARDFTTATDLTPSAPVLASPTPGRYRTLRYLQPFFWNDRLSFSYEAARADDAFELRLSPAVNRDLPRQR